MAAKGDLVSILYEADRLCNDILSGQSLCPVSRFNPLRGRQTLQRLCPSFGRGASEVSILYEADRLCN